MTTPRGTWSPGEAAGAPPSRTRGGRFVCFGDCELDRVEAKLRRRGVEVALRPKSFALLRYLAENPGRLVTRDELLRALWPGLAVSPSVVRVGVREVRAALGGAPLQGPFIETVGRQGYRFAPDEAEAPARAPVLVGRDAELARLHELFERCHALRRQFAFVSGEAGIGKSALVERFCDEVRGAGLGRIVLGQCVDLHGSTEPYLPILEMLGSLCRGEGRRHVRAILDRWAPSWLLQMPVLLDADAAEALRRRVPSPTRERMLREFADALEVLARDTPLVLILEDLHWSDASTVDLLAYVAERATPARLLVVGTYRPVEAVVSQHPLRTTLRDLLARRRGVEIAVDPLSLREVETYLSRLFTGAPIDPHLAEAMHAKTDGNPLFLTSSVEYLIDLGTLAFSEGRWQLGPGAESLPPSLRELVAREVGMLADDERAMLAAASVAGVEFDAISVAAASGQPLGRVEEVCARLAEDGQLLLATGTTSWPDGSIGGTYGFLHALHRDSVYDGIPAAERARLHRAIGERLESGWGEQAGSVAAALALHFELGAASSRAIHHHRVAIAAGKARLADREVAARCETVLSLLAQQPRSPERDQAEMEGSLDLGASLLAVRGYGTPEAGPLFVRARDLAVELGQTGIEMIARGGLYTSEVMGGDQRRALALAGDLLAMAERFPNPLFLMIGHTTTGASHYNLGNLVPARRHLERAREAWQPGLPRLPLEQKVLFLGIGSFVLQHLGDRPTAAAWHQELIEYVRDLDDPINAASAFEALGWYCLLEGDRRRGLELAERSLALAVEHGFPTNEALAKLCKGSALGDLALQREGFAALGACGYRVDMPAHRLHMAETLLGEERWEEAREELRLALSAVEATGEARHLAELHRALGACALGLGRRDEAEAALHSAVAIAREQEARAFEERALADLEALQVIR